MSVTYFLNKRLKVKDLKDKGYNVIDNRGNGHQYYPIGIKDGESAVCIDGYYTSIKENIDDTEFYRLEGKMFTGGLDIVFKIADDFDLKFMSDEEFEELYYREEHDFEKEDEDKLFDEKCDKYMSRFLTQ